MSRTMNGVEVLSSPNAARDRAWGIWLHSCEPLSDLEQEGNLEQFLYAVWKDSWREARIDQARRFAQRTDFELKLLQALKAEARRIESDQSSMAAVQLNKHLGVMLSELVARINEFIALAKQEEAA